MSPNTDRIIEIGAIVVRRGHWVKSYSSLVDPERPLPPFISDLTGIKSKQLKNAPTFLQIASEVADLFAHTVLVAHNARFDFGFLKNEMERAGQVFRVKPLCTVRLSRKLFPLEKGHGLDKVISRLGMVCPRRHRAIDDAKAVWEFLQIIQERFPVETIQAAWDGIQKRPSLPQGITSKQVDALPVGPGVYVFYDAAGAPLYVGKSIHIKDRVLAHFSSDHTRGAEMSMCSRMADLETFSTGGELGALLLESHLIKKLQPVFNRMGRAQQRLVIVKKALSPKGYYQALPERVTHLPPHEMGLVLGVFRSFRQAKDYLQDRAREFRLCPKLLTLEKGAGPCFASQLKRCDGACMGKTEAGSYNLRFESAFMESRIPGWPYGGPVQIKEGIDVFILDQWCLVGKLDFEEINQENLELKDYVFDYESFRILKRFLKNPKNKKRVQSYRAPKGWGCGQISLQWVP